LDEQLWSDGAKFDIRALAIFGPGPRCWACRTLFLRVAGLPYAPDRLSKAEQCTNLSIRDGDAGRDAGAPAGAGAEAEVVAALPGSALGGEALGVVSARIVAAIGAVASVLAPSLPAEGRYQYFGFDFMLDRELRPWVLECNSTPHLARCDRGPCAGQMSAAIERLLAEVIEPELGRSPAPGHSSEATWPLVFPVPELCTNLSRAPGIPLS